MLYLIFVAFTALSLIPCCVVALGQQLLSIDRRVCDRNYKCSEEQLRPSYICGSTGKTFYSLCSFLQNQCNDSALQLHSRRKCRSNELCRLAQTYARLLRQITSSKIIHPPTCAEDGYYAPIQCEPSTATCWCVTKYGAVIRNSTVTNRLPDCGSARKRNQVLRRSSHRRQSSKGTRHRRIPCTASERDTFLATVKLRIVEEYQQTTKHPDDDTDDRSNSKLGQSSGLTSVVDHKALRWQYDQLNPTSRSTIPFKQLKPFTKRVRQHISPKHCARRFRKMCDRNGDRQIGFDEWMSCFTTKYSDSFRSLNNNDRLDIGPFQQQPPRTASNPFGDVIPDVRPKMKPLGSINSMISSTNFGHPLSAEKTNVKSSALPNCREERRKALVSAQMTPGSNPIISSCSPEDDTLFSLVQCHTAQGLCWCADVKTGAEIPNTMVRNNAQPDCNAKKKKRRKTFIDRCEDGRLRRFFRRLFRDFSRSVDRSKFTTKWTSITQYRKVTSQSKFDALDVNGNNVLERSEWRPYKMRLKRWRGIKRCGRTFLRFCDANSNKNISKDEWDKCTVRGFNRVEELLNKRNPIDRFLKSD